MKPQTIKTSFACFLLLLLSSGLIGQTPPPESSEQQANTALLTWLRELYEPGVAVVEDSIVINEEAAKLLKDEAYRKIVYPEVYSWQTTLEFIKQQELKKAFWFMLNLYDESEQNKQLVVKSLLTYDALFKMDKILVSTFYTYSLTDPEIGEITDGKSVVTSPHILEQKLQSLKEILYYLDKYKKQIAER